MENHVIQVDYRYMKLITNYCDCSRVVSYRTGNVLYDGVFLLIRIYMGFRNKLSLVAQAATLGNFFNLHKCKMAADRYRSFFILEPLVPTSSVVGPYLV